MANRSRDDLVLQILKKLGVLAEGQTPGVEDTAGVNDDIPALLAKLAGLELVYVPDIDVAGIDEALFMPVASILAHEMSDSFGVTGDDAMELEKERGRAEIELKTMLRGRPTFEPQQVCYY